MHCQVINGLPTSPQPLPATWANVSNFNALDNATLASYGWFPFVPAVQPNCNPATHKIERQLQFDGVQVNEVWTVVPLTQDEQMAYLQNLKDRCDAALKTLFDQMAKRRGYFGFDTIVTYCDSTRPLWASDCRAYKTWRDDCVDKSIEIQAKVLAGQMAPPTVDQFIALMPPLWPDPNAGGSGGGTGNGTLT